MQYIPFPFTSSPDILFWSKIWMLRLAAPRSVVRGLFLCRQSDAPPAAPGSGSDAHSRVPLWACTNVVLCSISCSAWQGAVSETEVPCLCCPENRWIYTYLVRCPHIESPAFQPCRAKIAKVFLKELSILWLRSCPLPPVVASSTCQPWCPSVLCIYNCVETAAVIYVFSCLLSWLSAHCCS